MAWLKCTGRPLQSIRGSDVHRIAHQLHEGLSVTFFCSLRKAGARVCLPSAWDELRFVQAHEGAQAGKCPHSIQATMGASARCSDSVCFVTFGISVRLPYAPYEGLLSWLWRNLLFVSQRAAKPLQRHFLQSSTLRILRPNRLRKWWPEFCSLQLFDECRSVAIECLDLDSFSFLIVLHRSPMFFHVFIF